MCINRHSSPVTQGTKHVRVFYIVTSIATRQKRHRYTCPSRHSPCAVSGCHPVEPKSSMATQRKIDKANLKSEKENIILLFEHCCSIFWVLTIDVTSNHIGSRLVPWDSIVRQFPKIIEYILAF